MFYPELKAAIKDANARIKNNEALPADCFKQFPAHMQEHIICDNKFYFDKLGISANKTSSTPKV